MAQYWSDWSSSSNNESTYDDAQTNTEGSAASKQSQPPLPDTNRPPLPKGPSPS